ncbi:acetyl-CoA carboxylase biotin carboxyl carrier protein, partial [Acidithiobacillus ferrooxidans]
PPPAAAVEVPPQGYMIKSPMVGTFYRASSPESPPFVEEGSMVKAGQTLCIIEAMKLLNEIEADVSGKVIKVLAGNGQPVEYGEPLFIIAPGD